MIEIEKVEKGGRALAASGLYERLWELLTGQSIPKVYKTVKVPKLIERAKLGIAPSEGEPVRMGIGARDVLESFFAVPEPPRLVSAGAIRAAVAEGITAGLLAYTYGEAPELGADGRFRASLDRVIFRRAVLPEEIDLETGFVMLPSAVPERPVSQPAPGADAPPTPGGGPITGGEPTPVPTPPMPRGRPKPRFEVRFRADRSQIFCVFEAVANLADASDDRRVTIQVEGSSARGYDPVWLRNAVEEPLEESNVQRIESDHRGPSE